MPRARLAAALLPLLLPAFAGPALAQDLPAPPPAAADAAVSQPDAPQMEAPRPEPIVPVFPLRPTDRAAVPGRGGADPWGGLIITVTPIDEDAGADGAPGETVDIAPGPAAPPIAEVEIDPFAPSPDEVDMPSLWTSLELALGGDEPSAGKPVARVATQPVRVNDPQSLPTRFDLTEGPARFSVLTTVSTTAPESTALSTRVGGGSGEVKGRVGYVFDNLSVYGVGGLGAAESTGSVSLYDSALFGTAYSVPLAPIGLGAGDTVGAKVEVDRAATTATTLELRSADGKVERYISVERSTPADGDASGVVRAGVSGRF